MAPYRCAVVIYLWAQHKQRFSWIERSAQMRADGKWISLQATQRRWWWLWWRWMWIVIGKCGRHSCVTRRTSVSEWTERLWFLQNINIWFMRRRGRSAFTQQNAENEQFMRELCARTQAHAVAGTTNDKWHINNTITTHNWFLNVVGVSVWPCSRCAVCCIHMQLSAAPDLSHREMHWLALRHGFCFICFSWLSSAAAFQSIISIHAHRSLSLGEHAMFVC